MWKASYHVKDTVCSVSKKNQTMCVQSNALYYGGKNVYSLLHGHIPHGITS